MVLTLTIPTANGENSRLPAYHKFSTGDIVLLACPSLSSVKKVEGGVLSAHTDRIVVSVPEVPRGWLSQRWRMDKGANRVAHGRMTRALEQFTSSTDVPVYAGLDRIPAAYHPDTSARDRGFPLKTLLLDSPAQARELGLQPSILTPLHESPAARGHVDKMMSSWKLNAVQRETIQRVLRCRLSLVQGPPGTGKTHVAIHLLRLLNALYAGDQIPILATAYTNVAVDNLLEGLHNAGIQALRLGRPVKVRPELQEATLSARLHAHKRYPQLMQLKVQVQENPDSATLRRDMKELERTLISEIVRASRVICCTCIGAGDPLIEDQYFPLVVLDESTQAIEPASLIPLTKGAQHIVLLGDHYQLPPTVKSDLAIAGGLQRSLFQRLIDEGVGPLMLQEQYRMHPALSYFPSRHFYHNQIVDAVVPEDRPAPLGFAFASPHDLPIGFVPVAGEESRDVGHQSRSNAKEAHRVVDIVRRLLLASRRNTLTHPPHLHRRDVGIISPYAGQIQLLKRLFARDEIFTAASIHPDVDSVREAGEHGETQIQGGLHVATVDGFQGREKEVIIFSAVRSNSKGAVGFLADWRRLNVAITRARRALIVVGNPHTLAYPPLLPPLHTIGFLYGCHFSCVDCSLPLLPVSCL